jgi:hypothetical protein
MVKARREQGRAQLELALKPVPSKQDMNFELAYRMLLRVPSEGLPVSLGVAGVDSRLRVGKQVVLQDGVVTWYYNRHKTRCIQRDRGLVHYQREQANDEITQRIQRVVVVVSL